MSTKNTACIFGHREINETEELKAKVHKTVEKLITDEGIDTFLFGSHSRFNDFCLDIVTDLKKEKYPHVKRVYVRAMYPYVDESYKAYLLTLYDDTYYPEQIEGAGRAAYVERNYEMIENSSYCVIYYDEKYSPNSSKSGTKLAYDYAAKRSKEITNIFAISF